MSLELLISNKRTKQIWEVSNSVQSVRWTTNRTGAPGKLNFSIVKSGDLDFVEGDEVRFSAGGRLQFYGWVFTKVKDRWGVIEVTCYDRLRYLKASASYNFVNLSAGDILRRIAGDLQLQTSLVADTGYAIPSLVKQEQTCLDIMAAAIQQTLLNTGKLFVLFDDGAGLCLQEPESMKSDAVIGAGSLLTDYSYQTDIDRQTYNMVKLVRPNKQTGGADAFVVQDSKTIAQWGLLELYQKLDENMNDAQAQARARASLEYYNRRLRTLKVSSLGVPGLRAGQMVLFQIPGLGDINLDQYVLLEQAEHAWENGVHTMELETMAL